LHFSHQTEADKELCPYSFIFYLKLACGSDCTLSNDRMINELERRWMEAVIAWHLPLWQHESCLLCRWDFYWIKNSLFLFPVVHEYRKFAENIIYWSTVILGG
jgi:hypothetical protein